MYGGGVCTPKNYEQERGLICPYKQSGQAKHVNCPSDSLKGTHYPFGLEICLCTKNFLFLLFFNIFHYLYL